jgi:hypothetical protein
MTDQQQRVDAVLCDGRGRPPRAATGTRTSWKLAATGIRGHGQVGNSPPRGYGGTDRLETRRHGAAHSVPKRIDRVRFFKRVRQ